MTLSSEERERLKREVAACLSGEPEVRRIVVFGSFVTSPTPHDLDVAVFQESDEDYLPLALKYRRPTESNGKYKATESTGHLLTRKSLIYL